MPVGDRTHSNAISPGAHGAVGGYEGPRCRDCEGCEDARCFHFTCTITGGRRAPSAKACAKKKLRAKTPAAPRIRRCERCKTDISHKKATSNFCDDCLKKIRVYRVAPSKKKPAAAKRPSREESTVGEITTTRVGPWTPEDDDVLRRYAHEGRAAVADRLDRTDKSVANRAHRLGISLGGGRGHHPRGDCAAPPHINADDPAAGAETLESQHGAEAEAALAMDSVARPPAVVADDALREGAQAIGDLAAAAEREGLSFAEQLRQDAEVDELADEAVDSVTASPSDSERRRLNMWHHMEDADTTARRDALLHESIDGILQDDPSPAITITVANGTADREQSLRRELADTLLQLLIAARPGDELVCNSAKRVRALLKAL